MGSKWTIRGRTKRTVSDSHVPLQLSETSFTGSEALEESDVFQGGVVSAPHHMTLHKVARDGRREWLGHFLQLCTEGKIKINALDKDGFAALHYAVRFNRVDIIQSLLDVPCNPNVRTKDGLTPLHFAASRLPQVSDTVMEAASMQTPGRMIQMLLEANGRQVNVVMAKDNQGITPLHMACARGNEPAVQELLKVTGEGVTFDVNVKDDHGDTPLHEACICGNLPILKELLNQGAKIDIKNADEEISLHIACKKGFGTIVHEILCRGNNQREKLLEARDKESNSPLHLAVESGDVETVKVLLQFQANPSMSNDAKVVPMHIAAARGYMHIAEKLLDKDCKDCLDTQQQSPLHYAARANQVAMINFLLSEDYLYNNPTTGHQQAQEMMIAKTLRRKCDKDTLDNDAVSPLLLAVMWGRAEAVKALIDGGCKVYTTDKDGRSAVYWAAQEGHVDVLRILLEHEKGIQLCTVTELCHHNTPLHVAARLGKAQAIKLLVTCLTKQLGHILKVEHLHFRNDENKTPLHLAAKRGNVDVVRFLVREYPPSITDEDENGNTSLHLAARQGRTAVANFLITEGAEVDAKNGLLWTPLDLAADKGHAEVISLLIKAKACVQTKDKSGRTPLYRACQNGCLAAAKVLMDNGADVTVHCKDTKLNCLEAAVENGHKNIALAIIQSDQWDSALRHSHGQNTPFRRMIARMPSVAKAVLDRCMKLGKVRKQGSTQDGMSTTDTEQYKVEFIYEFLDDYNDIPFCQNASGDSDNGADANSVDEVENNKGLAAKWGPKKFSRRQHPLALMALHSDPDLLRHPVVISLLDYKWSKYGRAIFIINLVAYLIYLFSLTTYALLLPHPDQAFCHDFSVTQLVPSLPVNGTICPFESSFANGSTILNSHEYPTVPKNKTADIALYFTALLVIISAVIRLIVELVQFGKRHYRYFLTVENYIELGAYISSIIFVSHFGHNCWCQINWQWQLGAIGVFLSWINFILFLKRVPLLGIYVLMFSSILWTFLKFALIAFLFVVAFCISFYMILYKAPNGTTLLDNVSPFRNAGLSFIKTIVMTLGEFEYDLIFGHNCECTGLQTSFPEVGYILWIVFLIVMPILLNNLLVGLAVDDTKGIQDQASLKKLSLQISITLDAEELLPVFLRRRIVKPKREIIVKERRGKLRMFREDIWGKEHWNSVASLKKHILVKKSPIEQLQEHAGELSKDVKQMQTEMIELMNKNSHMEQLLMKLAEKQGIHLDPEEAEP